MHAMNCRLWQGFCVRIYAHLRHACISAVKSLSSQRDIKAGSLRKKLFWFIYNAQGSGIDPPRMFALMQL